MQIAKWKKPIWKGHRQYNSKYMTFYKWQNYRDSKKKSQWLPEFQAEGEERWISKHRWNCRVWTVMMETCH